MAPEPTTCVKDTETKQEPESEPQKSEQDMTSPPEENGDIGEETGDEREELLESNMASNIDFDELTPPLPPDGGYGWIIAACSFMTNLMVDGMCYMGGVLYIELLDYFKETKSKTQWVHTLVPAVYLVTGPFVGALVNKYGAREITIAGSIVATIFFVLSALAPCIEVLIFTYGIMIGVGFGLMYLPAVCFVSYYFDRKRALATGIAVCGSGIGTFIFPPLMNMILNAYGWRGSMLILAGMTLNCCVFGALLRPLKAPRKSAKKIKDQRTRKEKAKEKKMAKELAKQKSIIMQKIVDQKSRQRMISTGSLDGTVITTDNTLVKDPLLLKTILQLETVNKATSREPNLNNSVPDLRDIGTDSNNDGEDLTVRSQPSSPEPKKKQRTLSKDDDVDEEEQRNDKVIVNKYLEKVKNEAGTPQLRNRQNSNRNLDASFMTSQASLEAKRKDMERIMYRQDIFFTGSVTSIAEYRSNPDRTQYVQSVLSLPGSTGSIPGRCAPFTNVLSQMFDMSLFRSVTFVILMMNAFFSFMGFFVPFMFVPDLANIQGASINKSAFLISILGICNTVGRVAAGWLADRPWADCLVIQNVALIVGGISTLLVPFYTNYALLAVYAAVFGTCMAMFIALRSIVTAEMLGIQKLNNAFGLTIFFQGIAGIAGSPLAGTIFDATGSYSVSFVVAGVFITFSGLICLPLRRIAKWENSKTSGDFTLPEIGLDDLPFPSQEAFGSTKAYDSTNTKEYGSANSTKGVTFGGQNGGMKKHSDVGV